jgi:hypothetical protein
MMETIRELLMKRISQRGSGMRKILSGPYYPNSREMLESNVIECRMRNPIWNGADGY